MSIERPPFVIHVSEMADFPDAVYIGRENGRARLKRSKWHNPYKINSRTTRQESVDAYSRAVSKLIPAAGLDLSELTGKPLACWCRRSDEARSGSNVCHGDVLVKLWKERVA